MKTTSLFITALTALIAMNATAAPRSYTGSPITENFDGLGATGTSITLLTGWDAGHFNPAIQQGTTGGTGATTATDTLTVDNGSHDPNSTPMLGNFGTTGAADRALGSFARTTPAGDQFLQLAIKNDSGSPITSFGLSCRGEEWRSSNTAVQQLTAWYSNTSATSGFVSMGATFTFNTPNNSGLGQIDGNASGNFTAISGTYTPASPIPAGSTFYIRWYDINDNGIADDYLAIDDLTVTPVTSSDATVTLGLTGSPLAEAAGVATVTATLSALRASDVTVNLAFTGTATPTTDYTASANSMVIPAGNLSGSITLTAVQDYLFESPDETIVVDISTVVNALENGIQQVTATITDDDPAPPGIRFDAASSQSAAAVSTITWSHTVGSGNNRMLVVGVAMETNAPDRFATSVTFGSQSLTKVTGSRAAQDAPFNSTELWYLPAPDVGTGTITITLDGALSNGAECGAVSLFGVQQTAPEAVAIANLAGSGSSYSLAITTLTDGAWLVDVANNGSGNTAFTPTAAGMVERWDRNASTQMVGAGATREVVTAGTVTDTWTATGTSRKAQSIAAFAPVLAPMASTGDGDWHTPATWDTLTIPVAASPVTVTGNAVTITAAAANCNTLTLAGGASVAVTDRNLTVAGGTPGALNTSGGTLALDGNSTLNLAKANTSTGFVGLTVVSGTILNVTGELTVDANKDLSGTTLNTPKLTLAGGSTLTKSDGLGIGSAGLISGSGAVAGTVTVASGGRISPGTDTTIDTITAGGLTLASGSLLTLNAASTVSLDQIAVSWGGGLIINGGAITFLNGTGSGPAAGIGTYPLISYSGGIGGAGVTSLSVANPVPGTRYSFAATGSFVTLDLVQGPLWSGASGGLWSAAANWSGAAPGASDTLVYAAGGASGSSVNDLTGAAFPSIQFESGVNAFTLSGNKVVLTGDLGGACVVNNSANLQTLSLPVEINSALAVNTANGAVTLGGEVSGAGTLVKSGTNTLTLGGPNIHAGGTTLGTGKLVLGSTTALGATAGTLTITGGTTLDSSVTDLVLANNNPQIWNGNFTFTGSQNLNLGSGGVTMGANCDVTVSAKTLTVGGVISGSARTLTKRGTGTLVLNGTGSAVTKVQIYGGGMLQVGAGADLTSTSSLDITEVSSMLVSSGTFTCAGGDQGHDGQRASVVVEGTGTITSNGEWLMGRNMGSNSLIVKDSGIINGGGNPLRIGRDNIRDNYVSLRNNAQATFGSVVVFDTSGYAEGGPGSGSVLEIIDSASLTTGSMTIANSLPTSNATHPKYGNGQVYQSGGTVTINGNIGMALAPTDASDVLTATYNLGNGALKCWQINNGSNTLRGTANVNFHGGTLTYNNTAAQSDFINLGPTGKLYLYEGVTIDDNGQAVTISQPMLTPNSGQGLASITLATPIGAVNAYPITPEVLVTGGGGTGATAIAVLNGSGQVSAIKVTNPGLGYTSTPTVQLYFQGGATAVPAGSINLSTNAYTGGLTKKGAGTLTLAGTNTYTGATTVEAGILAVNGTSISNSGKLVISGGKVQATGTETVDTLFFGGTPQVVGTWGATGSGAEHIDDSRFTGIAGMVLVLTKGTGNDYSIWAGNYPAADLSNPDADYDHDGMTNQQEYAFGLDPTKGSSVNPIIGPPDKTSGMFKYTRRATPATTGLTYTVWTSTNLAGWTKDDGASAGQTVESTSGEVETVVVTLTGAPLTEAKLFMRVTAE